MECSIPTWNIARLVDGAPKRGTSGHELGLVRVGGLVAVHVADPTGASTLRAAALDTQGAEKREDRGRFLRMSGGV